MLSVNNPNGVIETVPPAINTATVTQMVDQTPASPDVVNWDAAPGQGMTSKASRRSGRLPCATCRLLGMPPLGKPCSVAIPV
jgi:hypothetical protein